MKPLVLHREDCCRGPLILVNRKYALHRAAQPEAAGCLCMWARSPEEAETKPAEEMELAVIDRSFPQIRLESAAATALCRGLESLSALGRIVPVSGYRSRREQEQIYRESLEENGPEFTGRYVALPDRSEHQTGYAIDLGEGGKELDFIRPSFPEEGICGRFRQEAARFGFILRYPAEKEELTGIAHEPWHFRYVGYPHSMIMEEQGLVLEEYTDFLRKQPKGVYWERHNNRIEVRYIEAVEETMRVELPKDSELYSVSGDNQNGLILTIWRKS